MTQKNKYKVEEVHVLRNSDCDLNGKGYQILQEFMFNERHYAVLRFEDDHPDDCFLYRVSEGNQLEEIEDEMEWEHVSDAIDEYLFFSDPL